MPHWEVRLDGRPMDIAEIQTLAPLFGGTVLYGAENSYWLAAEAIDSLDDPWAVRDYARELLAQLNGMARIIQPGHQQVTAETPCKVDETGSRGSYILPEAALFEVRVYAPSALNKDKHGNIISEVRPEDRTRLAKQIAAHPELRDILKMVADDLTWQKLRLAWEALSAFAGGEHNLKRILTKAEYDRFKANCHVRRLSGDEALHFNHPDTGHDKMTKAQALKWLGEVIQRYLWVHREHDAG